MKQPLFDSRHGLTALAIIVLTALFLNTGSLPLFDEDEGAYAQVTLEMINSGDMLTPRLGGELFFHKPPIIYWTQAACIWLTGPSELGFRLPSILASLVWATVLFVFVRRHRNRHTAAMAVFFLVTAMQISLITRAAIADALLNLFITVALFALYEYWLKPRRSMVLITYAALALGFMTKGPIAVVIPVIVSGIFYALQKSVRQWLRIALHPGGWVLFLAGALPWYVALVHTHGWHFIQEIFLVHNLGRFRSPMEGHSGSIFYYVPVILVGLMPFTTLLIKALVQIRHTIKAPLDQFLWIWFGFVLAFFSVAGTKLHHYIVYGYVPLVIFMACVADRRQLTKPLWLVAPPLVLLAVLLCIQDAARWALPTINDAFTREVVREALPVFGWPYRAWVAAAMAGIIIVAVIPKRRMSTRIVITGCLFFSLITGVVLPRVAAVMQGPVKQAGLMAKARNLDVVMWGMHYPSFHVYYGKPAQKRRPTPGEIVITKADKLDEIESHQIIYQRYGIILTRINAL